MARKTFDELVDEFNKEEQGNPPSEQPQENPEQPQETPPVEEPPVETPPAEDKPAEPPAPEDKPEDKPADKPEDKPADPPKDHVIDEIEMTNGAIRKRLEKQAKKFEEEKAALIAEYEAKLKAKETEQSKPAPKTRDNFQTDEDYVAWLTRQQIDADRAEQDKKRQEQEAEDAKKRQEQEAEAAEIQRRQAKFLTNIESCFDGEERTTFMKRVQYANSKGLGELLDANPVASDYLLGSQRGPLVLAKILDTQNPEYFRRVFPVGGINPLEQFAELKDIERTILAEKNAPPPAPAPAPAPAPKKPVLGKPGAQGQGGTGGDPMLDPKARRDYVRELLYGHK